MKSYEQFKAFYGEQLLSELRVLDALRKKILIKSALVIILALSMAASAPHLISERHFDLLLYLWIGCIAFVFGVIWYITKDYRYHFKQRIIQPLIRFIEPNLQYSPDGFVDLYTFRRAEIFQRYTNEFDGEDLVTGTIGKTKIKFSEVHARYEDEDSDLSESVGHPLVIAFKYLVAKCLCNRTVFKGLFFVADFHKTFYGKVLVVPDKVQRYFGRFGEMLQDHNVFQDELIKMDNAEFERHFVVYGSGQIQSRYVLTPVIMDRILEFRRQTGSSACLSFKDSMLYMAVPYKRNLFEPKYFKSMVDYITTFEYFHDLSLFAGLVEEFNLNTRIWTKE